MRNQDRSSEMYHSLKGSHLDRVLYRIMGKDLWRQAALKESVFNSFTTQANQITRNVYIHTYECIVLLHTLGHNYKILPKRREISRFETRVKST